MFTYKISLFLALSISLADHGSSLGSEHLLVRGRSQEMQFFKNKKTDSKFRRSISSECWKLKCWIMKNTVRPEAQPLFTPPNINWEFPLSLALSLTKVAASAFTPVSGYRLELSVPKKFARWKYAWYMNVRANKYKNHVIPSIHCIHQHILGRGLEDNKHHGAYVNGPMKKFVRVSRLS